MGLTLWSFVLNGDGAVVRVPCARFDRFYAGREALGLGLTGVACVIDVALELRDRRPVAALDFWYVRHLLRPDGRIDEEHKQQGLEDAVEAVTATVLTELAPADPKVTSIRPRLARWRTETEHRWQPTRHQLDSARDAINEAARRRLVDHDGRRLYGLPDGGGPYPPLRLR